MPRESSPPIAALRAVMFGAWLLALGTVEPAWSQTLLGPYAYEEPVYHDAGTLLDANTYAVEEPAFVSEFAQPEYVVVAPAEVAPPVESYIEYIDEPAVADYYVANRSLYQNAPSSNQQRANQNAQGQTTYGKQPDTPQPERRQFLRTQSPLLKRGARQYDVGVAYTLFEYNFPTIDAGGNLVRADLRRRTLIVPLSFRYGWSDRTQLYVNVPVGWRNSELATAPLNTPNPVDIGSNYGGVGDIQLGANHLLWKGCNLVPDCIVTFNAGLPTGEKSLLTNAFTGGLGTGFASLGGQIMFIHTYDPVAVFWGLGYNYYLGGDIQGVAVRLGDQFSYQFGVGYAINDRVTFSTSFTGAYVNPTSVSDAWVPNTQQEPYRLRAAVTIQRRCRIVEPFVEAGLTNTSPGVRTGITWTF